jgi:hypothetical protein
LLIFFVQSFFRIKDLILEKRIIEEYLATAGTKTPNWKKLELRTPALCHFALPEFETKETPHCI